ncbi:hypothetical protein BDA99DRAFT_500300 [Phascolomyces articulosus]|uniref:Uncharacterized protein n=1 Tax=Phascolomyces articulosus TaxID=60185 RepID=A0AAD5K679_9FUNG|nr:hypothetical protein BDA99DRAFT_500300 [Phascolomyces articulosus]
MPRNHINKSIIDYSRSFYLMYKKNTTTTTSFTSFTITIIICIIQIMKPKPFFFVFPLLGVIQAHFIYW